MKLGCFLKSETKTDRKPAVKITLQYKLLSAFCQKGKIAHKKISVIKKRYRLISCLLQSYGGLKLLGLFVAK